MTIIRGDRITQTYSFTDFELVNYKLSLFFIIIIFYKRFLQSLYNK